jgi:hypothetical protein
VDAVKQLSPIDIKWFYKIQEKGLCIHRKDLYKIIEDPMPKDVKKQIKFFNIYEVIMKKI